MREGEAHGPKARSHELTGISNRAPFEDPPGNVKEPADILRWVRFREQYHAASRLEAPSAFPLQLDFELTSSCNLRCSFCVHGQTVVPRRFLPRTLFESVIEEGERHGLVSIKLNYINEPLLRQDLPDLVRFARAHGVLNVFFATNGTLLTESVAEELIDAGVSKVMVSLDAVTPETFRAMRGSDDLDRIARNIEGLLRIRRERGVSWPALRVNFLRTATNVSEADAFLRRWEGIVDSVGFQDQVALPGRDEPLFREPNGSEPFRCAFPFKLLVIDSEAHILPCCTFSGREMPIGSAYAMTIEEAWTAREAKALRSLHAAGRGLENPVCRHCITGA